MMSKQLQSVPMHDGDFILLFFKISLKFKTPVHLCVQGVQEIECSEYDRGISTNLHSFGAPPPKRKIWNERQTN